VVRTPYPAAVRLCYIAAERWAEIATSYYRPGHSLLRERPHQLLNLVYSWCIERVDPDKLDEWLIELHELLEWQDADSETAINLESESFFAMQSRGG
jgi:hypothetical protein